MSTETKVDLWTDPNVSKSVNAVSIKLAPFWSTDPALWFAQAESQFTTRSITTQDTKFHYIVLAFLEEIQADIRDIILAGKPSYDDMKKTLIDRIGQSE